MSKIVRVGGSGRGLEHNFLFSPKKKVRQVDRFRTCCIIS